jgi:hypothetical protein
MNQFRVGEWIEVRSKDEILRTLDQNGKLDSMPFMPQMFKYCGQKFQIFRSAHKTCDTITDAHVARKLPAGIHLDLRCDGQAYGGCQAGCLIFWKEAWLKPVAGSADAGPPATTSSLVTCTEDAVWQATTIKPENSAGEVRYSCQATQLLEFTKPLEWYDARQYLADHRTGNESLSELLRGFIYVTYYYGALTFRGWPGEPGRWLYDRFQNFWGGVPFPKRKGHLPVGALTPASDLNLQAGEMVRVKSLEEIRKTIDQRNLNRGMAFDGELVPYCGGTFRVKLRVEKFIDEKTGKMKSLKTPAVILEDVYCKGRYSTCRMFCPRSIYSWWREVWLERLPK